MCGRCKKVSQFEKGHATFGSCKLDGIPTHSPGMRRILGDLLVLVLSPAVQRQIVALEELTLLKRERMPKRRGQWQGYLYKLPLQTYAAPKVQTTAPSPNLRSGQAAKSPLTRPHTLRHKPSIEPSYEPSHKTIASVSAERIAAFQKKQEGTEVVQHRIAGRIGDHGWLVLGEMNEAQRSRLCTLERQGRLDDETLRSAVLAIRIEHRRNRN